MHAYIHTCLYLPTYVGTYILHPTHPTGGGGEAEVPCFDTQKPLHTNAFTHKRFYTQTLLHTYAFTHRRSYTQTLLHTVPFTHIFFNYTQSLLHQTL